MTTLQKEEVRYFYEDEVRLIFEGFNIAKFICTSVKPTLFV